LIGVPPWARLSIEELFFYSLHSFRKACLFTVALANSIFPCCSGEECGFGVVSHIYKAKSVIV
jgi:hypothetical protein